MSPVRRSPAEVMAVPGVRVGTARAGIRYRGRDDLAVMALAEGSRVAAVFTRNAFAAAPVLVARRHLEVASPRWLMVNSGNANAGLGDIGIDDAERTCAALAKIAGCEPEQVLPFSTGVIGERLPVRRFPAALARAVKALSDDTWAAAARAIMTTDTCPKMASRSARYRGRRAVVTGIAKGAGMICPDMATMLAFVVTDATVPQALLDEALRRAVDASFNRITVDGDTSTNDACVLVATGRGGLNVRDLERGAGRAWLEAVSEVCGELALAIVADGEGATRVLLVEVSGGRSFADCDAVARTVAHSPLVKTAVHAADPNWGRILAAVGRAPARIDGHRVDIDINALPVVRGGQRAQALDEPRLAQSMRGDLVHVHIRLGAGDAAASVWSCDLSAEYVRINAEYRS